MYTTEWKKNNILCTNAFGAIVTLYIRLHVNIAKYLISRCIICVLGSVLVYTFLYYEKSNLNGINKAWKQRVYEAITKGPNRLGKHLKQWLDRITAVSVPTFWEILGMHTQYLMQSTSCSYVSSWHVSLYSNEFDKISSISKSSADVFFSLSYRIRNMSVKSICDVYFC